MDGKIVITGDPASLVSAMQKASEAVRGFQTQAESSFGRVQEKISAVQAKWVAMGSLLLSGAGFKEAVDTTVNLNKEAIALAKTLGISATQASMLNVALGDISQSKDTLIAASSKLTKTLKDDEEAFTRLGVQTRDQNGQFRNSLDIMLDVNKRLLDFKEGTDRNIEGMKIYGKSWGDVAGLLKLNTDLMEESRKKAIELNLIVGQENIEATARYRAAMNDVEDVLTAVKKAIGDAVMPALTDLGNEFSETGPQKVDRMRQAMAVLVAGFYGVKNGVEIVWISIKTIIQSMTVAILTLADTGSRALRFDFAGAKAAFVNGWAQIVEINAAGGKAIVDASAKNGQAMRAALERGFGPAKATAAAASNGGQTSSGGESKNKEDSLMRRWEAELSEIQLKEQEKAQAEGRFYQMSKEAEQQYWQSKRSLVEAGCKDEIALRKKLAETGLAVMRDQYDAEQASLKLGMEAAKNAYAAREIYMRNYVENARQRFGAESKEYKQALQDQEAMRREHEEKMRQIDAIRLNSARQNANAVIDESGRIAQLEFDLGLMTREQLLQTQRQYIVEKMRLDLEAADNEIRLYKEGTVEYEQALQRRLEIKLKYDAQLSENKNATTLEKLKPQTNIFNTAQSSFQNMVNSMLRKQQSFTQAMNGMFRSIGMAFIEEVVTKPFVAWLAGWARKLAMNMGFLSTEKAQEATAAATGAITNKVTALSEIMANAGVAASGAYAATALIPYVGPVLAPAAAATAFAGASAYGASVFSASGGFDIPAGLNPMTQLHQEEMVLPAKYANGLRDMIAAGGSTTTEGDVHLHLHTPDTAGARRVLMDNRRLIADALKAAYRDGKR